VVLAAAGVAFAWACWRGGVLGHPEARLGQWHHFYLAAPLAAAGLVTRRPWLLVLAAVLATDDAWQHVRQVSGAWDYQSPLRVAFAHGLWPWAPVQALVAWLNGAVA
jgi:hypothetical protein